jgi:hypothetical protein
MRLDRMIPAERDFPNGRIEARKTALVRELADWSSNARRRRQRRALVLVPALLAFLAVTGFTTYALTREPTHLESIACYDRAALDADVAIVSSDERHPVDTCGEVWRTGGFGQERQSPRLAACVLQTGAIGVFPRSGGETCAELGLADLPPSYPDAAARFAGLQAAIFAKVGDPASGSSRGGPQCLGVDDAQMIVRRELVVRGYADWEIQLAGGEFSAAQPCTDVSFDSAGKTVLLTPAGPRGAEG